MGKRGGSIVDGLGERVLAASTWGEKHNRVYLLGDTLYR